MSKESKGYKKMPKKIYIRTFGCQMNDRDSEVIAGLLTKAGYKLVDDEQAADVVIFNTCSVRQHAEDKVWSEVGKLAKQAKRGQFPLGTVPIIGLAGCMAQNYKEKIFKRAPAVDFVAGPSDIAKIPGILNDIIRGNKGSIREDKGNVRGNKGSIREDKGNVRGNKGSLFELKIWETDGNVRPEEIYHTGFYEDKEHAYVVISEGCSNYCSYCVVPYVRGELHNRDQKNIIKEIEEAISKGITSITLLGQNVNAYDDFAGLLKSVNDVRGMEEFTFITSHPKDTSAGLFKAMAKCGKLKKYLHLPVQSGSDRILKLMNRGYTSSQYLKLVDEYRAIIPAGKISTDVIVGFPSETEADFLQTFDLMKKIGFDSAYLFKYSPRPNTQAAGLPDDVPEAEKKRRHKILLDYQKGLHKEKGKIKG
jgi:tRNA-2-methylthio-N6-dimethylallyladenosine synthase